MGEPTEPDPDDWEALVHAEIDELSVLIAVMRRAFPDRTSEGGRLCMQLESTAHALLVSRFRGDSEDALVLLSEAKVLAIEGYLLLLG